MENRGLPLLATAFSILNPLSSILASSSPDDRINILQPWNQSPVRIFLRELEAPLELTDGFSAEDVLDFVGIFMHVIGGELDGVRQIKFPQAMVADDLTGALPTGGREEEDVALFVGGDKTVSR